MGDVLTIQGQTLKSPSKPWKIEDFSSFVPIFPLVLLYHLCVPLVSFMPFGGHEVTQFSSSMAPATSGFR